MEWILSCFANIRDWVLGKDFFFVRDSGKTISCLNFVVDQMRLVFLWL